MPLQRDFQFELLVRRAVDKTRLGTYVGVVLLAILGLFFLGFGIAIPFAPIIIVGLIPVGGIFLVLHRGKGEMKGEEHWIDTLVNHPQKIVWIKPISIRHTAAFVMTLYTETHFQVWTTEGLSFQIKTDKPEDQHTFFNGLRQYVPHAHIGYNDKVSFYYNSYRENFIRELMENGLYAPVGNLQV